MRSHIDIGTKDSHLLLVLDVMVLNLLDEERRSYSLCRICVLSFIILLALRSTCLSYNAVREDCLKPVTLLLTIRCNLLLSTVSEADTYVMMRRSDVEPQRDGHIVSHEFPSFLSRSSFTRMSSRAYLHLTVCPKCSVAVTFHEVSLPYRRCTDRPLLETMQQNSQCVPG